MALTADTATDPTSTSPSRPHPTRDGLLRAAVEVLIEDGYAQLTTRRVAARCGVAQSTLMHHFPTRAEFISAAVRQVATDVASEVIAHLPPRARTPRRRAEATLDTVWAVHNSPTFQAMMELWVAARTDPDVRAGLIDAEQGVAHTAAALIGKIFPDALTRPETITFIDHALSAMRGLAMLRATDDPLEIDRRWVPIRAHLLTLYESPQPQVRRSP